MISLATSSVMDFGAHFFCKKHYQIAWSNYVKPYLIWAILWAVETLSTVVLYQIRSTSDINFSADEIQNYGLAEYILLFLTGILMAVKQMPKHAFGPSPDKALCAFASHLMHSSESLCGLQPCCLFLARNLPQLVERFWPFQTVLCTSICL